MIGNTGSDGMTVKEVREALDVHHGQASGVLSKLHAEGVLARLSDTRKGCKVYVLDQHVNGRQIEAQGSRNAVAA